MEKRHHALVLVSRRVICHTAELLMISAVVIKAIILPLLADVILFCSYYTLVFSLA